MGEDQAAAAHNSLKSAQFRAKCGFGNPASTTSRIQSDLILRILIAAP